MFASLVRDKHSFVLCLYPLYFYLFVYFVIILCALFVNYSPTQIRNTCVRLIWGYDAFF